MTDTFPLGGMRLLVVEDETLVAMLLEDMLSDLGCEIVGPVGTVTAALELAEREQLDGAILDVNLAGSPIYPVADVLRHRGVPFLFTTGYGAGGVEEKYAGAHTLQKPFQHAALERAVLAAFRKD